MSVLFLWVLWSILIKKLAEWCIHVFAENIVQVALVVNDKGVACRWDYLVVVMLKIHVSWLYIEKARFVILGWCIILSTFLQKTIATSELAQKTFPDPVPLLCPKKIIEAVMFSAQIASLSASASFSRAQWSNTQIVALLKILFVTTASLNVAAKPVIETWFVGSKSWAFVIDLTFLTNSAVTLTMFLLELSVLCARHYVR